MACRLHRKPLEMSLRALLLGAVLIAALSSSASARSAFRNLGPALEEQRRLVAANPSDAELWNDLGNLLLLDRREQDALGAYRKATSLDPQNTSALYNLALLLRNHDDLVSAEALLSSLLALDSNHARAHYQMGAIHEAQGNTNAAIGDYATAFGLDPELVFPRVNPDVIANGLMLESLLERNTKRLRAPRLATLYEESDRIVELLVPPIEDSQNEEPAVGNVERRAISEADLSAEGSLNQLKKPLNQQDGRHGSRNQRRNRESLVEELTANEEMPPPEPPRSRR